MKDTTPEKTKSKFPRSYWRALSLLSLCAALGSLAPEAQAQKKGVAGHVGDAAKVSATWAYDWAQGMPTPPAGVEYVPMWWSYYGASQAQDTTGAQSLKSKGAKSLLAYNEPDSASQANLSVAYALQGFKQAGIACSAAGLGLISPACTDDNNSWMQQFMAGVSSQGLKCDAVAVHSYLRDPYAFINYVDGIYNRYGKPLWITEFAPTDWATPTAVSVSEVLNFIKIVIPALESRSYVVRYSWYCGTSPGTGVLQTAALFNTDGTLTAAGAAYKNPSAAFTGTWRLQNRANGLMLDNLGSTQSGSNVCQWAGGSSSNQKWMITLTGGYHKLQCVTGGKFLDTLGHTADGSTIGQWINGGSLNQQWTLTATDSGYYKFSNRGNGKCLDTGGQTANGAAMQNWGSGSSWNQQWKLVP